MDPFQVRMEFLELLKRLNASEQSIRNIVVFALQYATRCPDDIWACVMTECRKAPSNTRINVLFMLDSFLADDFETNPEEVAVYRTLATRDLPAIIDMVVPPDSWDAVLNITSTRQILASWESKRIFEPSVLAPLMETIEQRATSVRDRSQRGEMADVTRISRTDVLRRIEEDRERHKRLRENSWKLPPMSYLHALDDPPSNASSGGDAEPLDAVTLEFEQHWDNTSDLNEDDLDYMREQSAHWWGNELEFSAAP